MEDKLLDFGFAGIVALVVVVLATKVVWPLIERWREDSIAREMRDSIAALATTVATIAETQVRHEVRIEVLEREQCATAQKLERVAESLTEVATRIHVLIQVMEDRERRQTELREA